MGFNVAWLHETYLVVFGKTVSFASVGPFILYACFFFIITLVTIARLSLGTLKVNAILRLVCLIFAFV